MRSSAVLLLVCVAAVAVTSADGASVDEVEFDPSFSVQELPDHEGGQISAWVHLTRVHN